MTVKNEKHLKVKLLGTSLQLLELERQKVELQETFTRSIRDRIIFDLPMKGAVGFRRHPQCRNRFQDRGTVSVVMDDEVVHEVPLELYDRFEYYLSKAKNYEEFARIYRELVSECFSGRIMNRKVPGSYYDKR